MLQGGNDDDDAEKIALKCAIKVSISRQHDEIFASLAYAAKAGDIEIVRSQLRRGAEINDVDYDGRTILAMVGVFYARYLLSSVPSSCVERSVLYI